MTCRPCPPSTHPRACFFANGDSLRYQGVTWDTRFKVVGDACRVDPATPWPLYGIPHSGNYFVTSEFDGPLNDGLLLTGARFGHNAYDGFGAGADVAGCAVAARGTPASTPPRLTRPPASAAEQLEVQQARGDEGLGQETQ